MPFDDPDPQDPMLLVGVELPAKIETHRDMAYAFAEEFARLGYDGTQILALFQKPFYGGAHGAYVDLGEAEVKTIIDETTAVWGRMRLVDRDPETLLTVGGGES